MLKHLSLFIISLIFEEVKEKVKEKKLLGAMAHLVEKIPKKPKNVNFERHYEMGKQYH